MPTPIISHIPLAIFDPLRYSDTSPLGVPHMRPTNPIPKLALSCAVMALFTATAFAVTETAKIVPDDFESNAQFGYSVAIDSDTIVVGAPFDDNTSVNSGSAYVYVLSGGTWILQQKLSPAAPIPNGQFGIKVAISGDFILAASLRNDSLNDGAVLEGQDNDQSSVYVFLRQNALWSQQQILNASDQIPDMDFGQSIALEGDTAIIGAPRAQSAGLTSGAAYLFTQSGGVWTETQKITPDDAEDYMLFGRSVSLSGAKAIIGSRGAIKAPTYIYNGAAYIFTFDGLTWAQQQKLEHDDPAKNDSFGHAVAISGDNAFVGIPEGAGDARMYLQENNTWTQTSIYPMATDFPLSSAYGAALAMSSFRAIVGIYKEYDIYPNSGRAYLHQAIHGTCWESNLQLNASDRKESAYLGFSVALSNDTAVLGAPGYDNSGINSTGAAYIYENLPPVPMEDNETVLCTAPDSSPADLCNYWPFAVGNWWGGTEANPERKITALYVINGYKIWKMHINQSTFASLVFLTTPTPNPNDVYYVFVNDMLYSAYDLNDLNSLPTITPEMDAVLPRYISDGQTDGCLTYHVGTISEIYGNYCSALSVANQLGLCPEYPVIMLDVYPCGLPMTIILAKDLGIVYWLSDKVSYDIVGLCDTPLSQPNGVHSADTSVDFSIDLSELLRVIQFFNLGTFHCDSASSDGYNPGPGDQSCSFHSSDYVTQDWTINLAELLRAIQIFNLLHYYYCPQNGTDDGFCVPTTP